MSKRKLQVKSVDQPIVTPLYTYNDWWKGKVHLIWSTCVFDEQQPVIAGVDWDRFSKADITRIRNKQRQLYRTHVRELNTKWKKDFTAKYKRSQLKHILLQRDLKTFFDVMFRPFPNGERVRIGPRGLMFGSQDLGNIQRWITSVIIDGNETNYNGVHSPNCPYKEWRKIPDDVYAEACWNHYKWLRTFLPKKGRNEKVPPVAPDQGDVRFNSHIFRNKNAELLFDDYCKSYNVELKKKSLALLSFIYWKMKRDQLLNDITPTQFRNFLSALPDNYALYKLKTYDKCKSPDKVKIYEICKSKLSL